VRVLSLGGLCDPTGLVSVSSAPQAARHPLADAPPPSWLRRRVGDAAMTKLAGQRAKDTKRRFGHEAAKTALDVFGSLVGIVLLSPLLVMSWCLVRWTSAGPALYRQQRLGRNKQPFMLLKFRTMCVNNDDQIHRQYVTSLLSDENAPTGGQRGLYKLENDPRITRVGTWLRRFSLDELPQLFNVLRGEMSLVGPRPVLAWEAEMFRESHHQRFEVKPGITGLWQVSGRSRLSYQEQLDLDVEYVRRKSFALDLAILADTIPALFRDGAV
jgi:lipopolysaccharide/colanic/teichoic acid biosynthesis glycosyltransferase